jgi:YD repeat-containing protein
MRRLTAPAGYQALQYDGAGVISPRTRRANPTAGSLYDAENRLSRISFPGMNQPIQYVYDADGRRVRRISASQYVWQVYGMDGELLSEYYAGQFVAGVEQALPVTNILFQKEYGYRTGQLLITASSGDDKRIDRFVTNFYFAALGREPSATELSQQHAAFIQAAQQGQSQLLAAAQTLGQQLFDLGNQSNEYNQRNRSDEEFVTDLYFAYLQRSPDEVGLG